MTLSQLVLRSMQKNIKHYYLYFFALIFSVTLYFSFITLQYNDSVLKATNDSGTATAGFEAASYLLYFIVTFFVLYANHLFMKRRSKEIGLYQLIGMTKGLIVRLVALENMLLFVGAVIIGMGIGFLSSRVFAMILLKVLDYDAVVSMTFSAEAITQTGLIFGILLVVILIQMTFMIRRVSLLSLFTASKQADERVKRFSPVQMTVGAIGIGLIVYGYYASTELFSLETGSNLFQNMIIILVTTIGGTFLVFRFSVSFVMNLVRLKKNGHLRPVDVLAVTPIMHRMKGNAKSLTLITVLTAVSLAITTLSYISYYSSESGAERDVPADYIFVDDKGTAFLEALEQEGIAYDKKEFNVATADVNIADLMTNGTTDDLITDLEAVVHLISLSEYQQIDPNLKLEGNEAIITSYTGFLSQFIQIEKHKEINIQQNSLEHTVFIKEIREDNILASRITYGGALILIVKDELYDTFLEDKEEEETLASDIEWSKQTSVFLKDESDRDRTEILYKESGANLLSELSEGPKLLSQEQALKNTLRSFGVIIFTTAFLGLAFLLATGSILYFKQMSEADEELPSYTILRKIGFTQQEIMRGIYAKQAFNFGVPLLIGLLHSYFAVKSGWFLFGSELVTPLIVTMLLYVGMYIVFMLLSIGYYKKIIKRAL
ncbi:ABC transporter permease [Lysinibacillus sp. 54212]|uniref:ABC transporter permease n=1 Tax=Lysinibacillus sp. 54212 TaxID=3119829 RepID=UPI002FC6291A